MTAEPQSRQSEMDVRLRTCTECGELLDDAGQFHPYTFCALKRAAPSLSSWEAFRWTAARLGLELPETAPLVRDLPKVPR